MRMTTFSDYSLRVLIHLAAAAEGRATIAEMWPDYAFDLGLDRALIANLEGHWRMVTAEDQSVPMPDFMADLAPKALQAADPSRVTYLR